MTHWRAWFGAGRQELFDRMIRLEGELALAATYIEGRERYDEEYGIGRSTIVSEWQRRWKELLQAAPAKREEAA